MSTYRLQHVTTLSAYHRLRPSGRSCLYSNSTAPLRVDMITCPSHAEPIHTAGISGADTSIRAIETAPAASLEALTTPSLSSLSPTQEPVSPSVMGG